MKKIVFTLLMGILCPSLGAQSYKKPLVSAIKEKDLRIDMYQMAADQFWGREAGTLDELKVSVWFADKMKEAGIKPAGDNGTYFQFFDMYRHQISPLSSVKIGDKNLKIWKDILVSDVVNAHFSLPIISVGEVEPEQLTSQIAGKVVAINVSKKGIEQEMTLFERRYPRFIKAK